ncbi:hypothetical protein J6590_017375 [Homalodisca vitripennis]|nr:hypothetical protein J6590_017375 [Homalodisca vitripennis]
MLRLRAKGNTDEEWPPPPPPIIDDRPPVCTSKLHQLSTTGTVVAVISVTSLIYIIALLLNNRLPLPLNISDETFNPDRFIAERARSILEELADLGPKVAGSYVNEVLAVHYLTVQINYTINEANPIHKISYDLQRPTGAFSIPHKLNEVTYHYNGVQNIVVKIGPNTPVNGSLLVNCHFDSVPTSPGASDDGLNCAVMLEVLRVISRQSTPLQQNIIFLFNGAEETPLMASHGFITQHKWAPEVRAFINLESAGAGGKEVLFQSGPNHPWLVQTCFPHSALFQSAAVKCGAGHTDNSRAVLSRVPVTTRVLLLILFIGIMTSSEDEGDVDKKLVADRELFVKILSENTVLLEKSRVPKVLLEKKKAWETLCSTYSQTTGNEVNATQMNKMLQNMKTKIKKKSDVKATGNKKIKLPGACQSTSVEATRNDSSDEWKNLAAAAIAITTQPHESEPEKKLRTQADNSYTRPANKKLLAYETGETKDLNTPQLQRLVLLQQLELQKIQIEKEKIELQKLKGGTVEKETQTDDYSFNLMFNM